MFDEKPDISETLEWMLQSRQVGDEILVRTLVQDQYSVLYQLGIVLLNTPDDSQVHDLTEQVICAAVEGAQDYSQAISVRVWLFRIAIEIYQSSLRNGRSKLIGNQNVAGERSSLNRTRNFWMLFNMMTDNTRLIIILSCMFDFSIEEIANIIDLPATEVAVQINQLKDKRFLILFEAHIEPFSMMEIESILSDRWPAKKISYSEEITIVENILNIIQEKEQRKRRFVILGELLLIVFAVILVIGTGNVVSELTPDPTSQRVYQTELVNQIIYVSPTPAPTQPPTPFPDIAVIYRAEGGETLYDIADLLTYNAIILEALNNIPAGQPLATGQRVMIGLHESQVLIPTAVGGIDEEVESFPTKELINLRSNEEEIRQLILDNKDNWSSLWVDALVIQYGPPGYKGMPDLRRQQIWIQQPNFSYLLDGENGGIVEYIYGSQGGLVNFYNTQTREQLTGTDAEQIPYYPYLQRMLLPSEMRDDFRGEIDILRRDSIAGRDVLVLDWYRVQESSQGRNGEILESRIHQGRYWVDTSLGLILRKQTFNGNDLNQVFEEILVTNLEINPVIPSRLFDQAQLPQTYFAENYRGDLDLHAIAIPEHVLSPNTGRELASFESPPENFQLNESRLSFKWTNLETLDPSQGTHVNLFADRYFLGNIEFAEPSQLMCTRSSGGNLIAFSGWSDELPYGYTPIRWFNLAELPTVHESLPEIEPYDFVFSPDSRQLAVYGCHRENEQNCGIYLVDTQSGESRFLKSVVMGKVLLWNPDSSEIAIQASFRRKGIWRVLVFDIVTGYTVFDGPFDWEGFWVAPESPIHDWGVPYPPTRGGLEICSPPPSRG
jgi:DNA-directed RNA polymerase specialized sigma24 family protein